MPTPLPPGELSKDAEEVPFKNAQRGMDGRGTGGRHRRLGQGGDHPDPPFARKEGSCRQSSLRRSIGPICVHRTRVRHRAEGSTMIAAEMAAGSLFLQTESWRLCLPTEEKVEEPASSAATIAWIGAGRPRPGQPVTPLLALSPRRAHGGRDLSCRLLPANNLFPLSHRMRFLFPATHLCRSSLPTSRQKSGSVLPATKSGFTTTGDRRHRRETCSIF